MESYQIVGGLGILLALAGGVLAAIGTTNMALFVVYGVMFVAGLALLSVSKKLRDQR